MLLGGVLAAGILPLHMRNGLRPEFLEKSGALLFIWTLYVLGVTGGLSVILAVQALRDRRVASLRHGVGARGTAACSPCETVRGRCSGPRGRAPAPGGGPR